MEKTRTFPGSDQFPPIIFENGIFPAPISVLISIPCSTAFPIKFRPLKATMEAGRDYWQVKHLISHCDRKDKPALVHETDCLFYPFFCGNGNFPDICQCYSGPDFAKEPIDVSPEEMKQFKRVNCRAPVTDQILKRFGVPFSISSRPPNAILTGIPFRWNTPSMDILQIDDETDKTRRDTGIVINDPVRIEKTASGLYHFIECGFCLFKGFFRNNRQIIGDIPGACCRIECAPVCKTFQF